jgi:uncharacterized protein (DUF1778 family)
MPRAKAVVVEEAEENGEKPSRISINIDPSLSSDMRLAAAIHNMDKGEWAVKVLRNAAREIIREAKVERPEE